MSLTTIVILAAGALFVGTRLPRMARLWRDLRDDRAAGRAAEAAFLASQRLAGSDSVGGVAGSDGQRESSDLGVALALALREAEAEATGKGHLLDAP